LRKCDFPLQIISPYKILKSIWSNFQSSFRIIYWFIFWQCTPKQILIKVLTAMIIMPPYQNILLYGIESFICTPINLIRSFWKQSFNFKFHFSQMHKMDASSHPSPKTTMYLNFISSLNSLIYLWNNWNENKTKSTTKNEEVYIYTHTLNEYNNKTVQNYPGKLVNSNI
jgi:hypothetical protein